MKKTFFCLLLLAGTHLLKAQTATLAPSKKPAMSSYISSSPLAADLVRIGKEGIEPGNNQALDAYFAEGFVLHSQSGDMNLMQLKAYWASLRRALTGFTITREQIIVEGRMASARSTFTGTFMNEFAPAGAAVIQPTGKPVKYEVISTFRYNEAGRLAEEWVQSDQVAFLRQFGVDLLAQKK